MKSQNNLPNVGVNLTGLERYWLKESIFNYKDVLVKIDELYNLGFRDIRLPVSFAYHFKNSSKNKFLRHLTKIIKHIKKKKMTIIICYFDDTLKKETNYTNLNTIKNNWKFISKKLKKYSKVVSYEILNEPNLYPKEWDEMVNELVLQIRKKDKKTKILIGATNFNSIYELSRKKIFSFKNIIYTFHFYEPFIFTHQGASWVGNQNKTINLPYPYNSYEMPEMNEIVKGTSGEINYKDYKIMANKTSLSHKIELIKNWSKKNNVRLWCTEFGVIKSIPLKYRCQYFKDLTDVLQTNNIKSYVWEYSGNFGFKENKEVLNCINLF
ncbi:MAG: cellulase family glycosylhydrolase [Polaribacter sp.]|uniref:glycoside hydrolase family 5 protein n=1 Tax=Polaribacter sp. TaxID=1920175 RepID=UPI0032632641